MPTVPPARPVDQTPTPDLVWLSDAELDIRTLAQAYADAERAAVRATLHAIAAATRAFRSRYPYTPTQLDAVVQQRQAELTPAPVPQTRPIAPGTTERPHTRALAAPRKGREPEYDEAALLAKLHAALALQGLDGRRLSERAAARAIDVPESTFGTYCRQFPALRAYLREHRRHDRD
jgi:hypothetical protein